MGTSEEEFVDRAGAGDVAAVTSGLGEGINCNAIVGSKTAIEAAAWNNHLEVVELLLDNGAKAHDGVERSSSLAVYQRLAHTPRSARQAQSALRHIAGWAYYCEHEIADLIAVLVEDGAVVNRDVVVTALERADRSQRFFDSLSEAGASLDVLWSELPKNRKKNIPVRKTLRDRRVAELSELIKTRAVPTAKALEKALLTEIGGDPGSPIPVGDGRWHAAQRLAYCADGDTRSTPARREFERSKLPRWICSAVEASLGLLPAALAEPLAALDPTEPAVLAALVGGAQGVTPGSEGLLAATYAEARSAERDRIALQLLDAGVSPDVGGVSPLVAYLGHEDDEGVARRLAGSAPLTKEEEMYVRDRGWTLPGPS